MQTFYKGLGLTLTGSEVFLSFFFFPPKFVYLAAPGSGCGMRDRLVAAYRLFSCGL